MDVRMKVEGLGEGTPPERSGGGVRAPEVAPTRAGEVGTESEVEAKATRRRFTAEYKLWVLEQADRCEKPGELGALLRREGLYSSHLTQWREQRRRGVISGLRPKRRGRKPEPGAVERKRIEELERERTRGFAAGSRRRRRSFRSKKKRASSWGSP
jgi:hypothetical protein